MTARYLVQLVEENSCGTYIRHPNALGLVQEV